MSTRATDLTALTASAAVDAMARGEFSAAELFEAYRAAAAADELNAYLWVADDASAAPAEDAPLAGVPLAVKDLFCTEGVPSQAGSKILEGYRPPYTATVVERLAAAGAPLLGKTNQDEFAMGSSNENSAFGPGPEPLGPRPRAGRLERWQRRRRGGRLGAMGAGHRHRRLDPPARGAVRDRRIQAHVRHGQPLRDDRLRVVAGPGGSADARRDRRGAAAAPHGRPGRARLDLDRLSRRDRPPDGDVAGGDPARRARGADRRGRRHRRRRAGGLQRDAEARRAPRRERPHVPPAARAPRAGRLLRARAGRGVVEPRALRRRALRRACRERRSRRDVHDDPQPGLRHRGQAPNHARHVLAVQRLLRRLLRPGAARAHEDRR